MNKQIEVRLFGIITDLGVYNSKTDEIQPDKKITCFDTVKMPYMGKLCEYMDEISSLLSSCREFWQADVREIYSAIESIAATDQEISKELK